MTFLPTNGMPLDGLVQVEIRIDSRYCSICCHKVPLAFVQSCHHAAVGGFVRTDEMGVLKAF